MKAAVDATWAALFGLSQADFQHDSVHIVAGADADDVVSVMVNRACIVRVPDHLSEAARDVFGPLTSEEAFSKTPLEQLVHKRGEVVGLSWHHYGTRDSLELRPDSRATHVLGNDAALMGFLETNSLEDWAESGFPRHPPESVPSDVKYWLMRDQGRVVAAGNMTPWRGMPSDVGVLVAPTERGRGFASTLVGAMVTDCDPGVDVLRYRALSTNTASLAVAERIGFERYGGNYLAKLSAP